MEELMLFIDKLIEEILSQLALIGEKGDILVRIYFLMTTSLPTFYSYICLFFTLNQCSQSRKQQGGLALDLVNILIGFVQMNPTSATLAVKLFGLAKKTGSVDPQYLANTLSHIENKRGPWFQDLAAKLAAL
jgi:hypothetical protein